jgi:ABC-type phosphate transport system substrate-binding protein
MKAFALFSILFWISSPQIARAGENGFQVIVNQANNLTTVDQKFLAEIFLKKRNYWPNARAIFAIDLEPESRVRRQFSEKILDRSVSAVRNYWQQLLFSGRGVPPPEFKTEEEVLHYVASHEEAIGYVSAGTDVRAFRVLKVE